MAVREKMNEGEKVLLKRTSVLAQCCCCTIASCQPSHFDFRQLNSLCSVIKYHLVTMQFNSPFLMQFFI